MTIRAEIKSDPDRGPGHGLLFIEGMPAGATAPKFSVMSNQGQDCYLGPQRSWQPTEAFHEAPVAQRSDARLVLHVGPEIVDALVEQPSSATFRITVLLGSETDVGTLRVSALLGSRARDGGGGRQDLPAEPEKAVPPDPPPPPPVPEREPAKESSPRPAPTPPPPPLDSPRPRRRRTGLIVASLLFLAIAGGGAAAWYFCLIPVLSPGWCSQTAEHEDETPQPPTSEPTDTTERVTPPAPTPPSAEAPAEAATCRDDDPPGCLRLAREARTNGELEKARQLFQRAARIGAAEANVEIARMYDPETWSSASSPAPKPDWETAVFWYEAAGKAGDVDANVAAGSLLCANGSELLERSRGAALLRSAAAAGNEKARSVLSSCKAAAQ